MAIDLLSEEGNQLDEEGQDAKASQKFLEALKLVPEPVQNHAPAGWLLTSIGDMAFKLGRWEDAKKAPADAMSCPDVLGNPFVYLRLGQCQFELGNLDRAADELARAYMGAGRDIFTQEPSKYLNFLATRIKPPPGQAEL